MANAKEEVRAVAPEFIKLTDDFLFGDIWKKPGISARDKSLVTITTLAALGKNDQLTFHIGYGLDNGLKQEEIVAAFTHMAFYAGWPVAMSGLQKLNEVVEARKSKKQ